MSVKIMGLIWDLKISKDKKFVLLAYADHASHDGTNIYPAVKSIAEKTGYSERSVQIITRNLEKMGILIADGQGTHGTNRWRIPISGGKIDYIAGGAESAPGGCRIQHRGGAEHSTGGVQQLLHPNRPLTINEPSLTTITRAGEVFKAYESEIGIITPRIRDAINDYLDDLKISPDWIIEAIQISATQNKRNWAYCAAILKRWAVEGKTAFLTKQKPNGPKSPMPESVDEHNQRIVKELVYGKN